MALSSRVSKISAALAPIIAIVIGVSASAQDFWNYPVVEAIIANDTAAVTKFLADGLDPNRDYEFEHPRWNDGKPTKMWLPMVAGMFGRLDILKGLYAHPQFKTTKEKNTYPLCMTISHRHPEVALFLLTKDVYVDPPGGCSGWFSPMARAKEQELDDVVAALRKAGAP